MTDLTTILSRLYASEINVEIACFWDGGWTVKLGDAMNGYPAERTFRNEEIAEITPWLVENACRCWPGSVFAREQSC